MIELIAVAIVALVMLGLVTTGYGIGLACTWWDRWRTVKRYHNQRKG